MMWMYPHPPPLEVTNLEWAIYYDLQGVITFRWPLLGDTHAVNIFEWPPFDNQDEWDESVEPHYIEFQIP